MPEGENQLVLLDDQHIPTVQNIDAKFKGELHPPHRLLITGTCEHPEVMADYHDLPATVFFSKTCVWNKSGDATWTRWKDGSPGSGGIYVVRVLRQ